MPSSTRTASVTGGGERRVRAERASAAILAAALACTAGFADGQSYLSWHLFSANMTGNTVLLGIAMTKLDVSYAASVAAPIAAFIAGCGIAQVLRGVSRPLCFALEALLFVAGAFTEQHAGQLELLAIAMGIQNTTVKQFADVKANTSFITGNYERLGQALARVLTRKRAPGDHSTLAIVLPLVVSYALGAVIAGTFVAWHVPYLLVFAVPVIGCSAYLARGEHPPAHD